jgi:hypothetical protein
MADAIAEPGQALAAAPEDAEGIAVFRERRKPVFPRPVTGRGFVSYSNSD